MQIVALDTTPLIYFIEENPNYLDVTDALFEAMFSGEFRVVGHRHHPQRYPKLMRVMFDWLEAKIQFHHQEAASLALLFLPVIPLTPAVLFFLAEQ
ncbi:hypothetical protein [Nostoc sp.]|uniref:hypothetical protein n=1 Tax=Nostoc sp. TaxID=1180 RepID=UPI002FFD2893